MAHQDDTPRTSDAGHVGAPPDEVDAGAGPASRGAASGDPTEDAEDKPHETRVVVWDTPAAIERGKRFAVRLGAACSGCRPDGWRVEVRDHEGERRATATLGEEPWPGTDGLYHAEVDLVAPDAEGLYTWEAAAVTGGAAATGPAVTGGPAVAHTGGSARFGVRVVSAPACVLTVVALDAESRTPVEGARVVAHPYRAVTDERGVAELRVPAGEYRLFVSGKGCIPFRFDGEVKADTTIRAELAQDRELSDADIWS